LITDVPGSALRGYEDLLGITTGGSDGDGHLGIAGQAGLRPFGSDAFNARPSTN
jgi:phosphatidylinositol-3-phosphatase